MAVPGKLHNSITTEITLRVVAASVGAYALTYEATAFVARALPWDRLTAVIAATNLGFALMTGLVLWSFCSRRPARLLAMMAVATLILGGLERLAGL